MTPKRTLCTFPLFALLLACPAEDEENTDSSAHTATSSGADSSEAASSEDEGAGAGSSGALDPEIDARAMNACNTFCASVEACGDTETCSDVDFCEVTAALVTSVGDNCIAMYEAWTGCIEQIACDEWEGDVEDIPVCSDQLGAYASACLL